MCIYPWIKKNSFVSRVMLASAKTFGCICLQPEELAMSVQLLIVYPPPKDPAKFDRAYREEHLPYAKASPRGSHGCYDQARTRFTRRSPVRPHDLLRGISKR